MEADYSVVYRPSPLRRVTETTETTTRSPSAMVMWHRPLKGRRRTWHGDENWRTGHLRDTMAFAHRLGVLLALPLSPLRLSTAFRPFSSSTPVLAKPKKRMPPKKAAAAEKKTLLGRPSNNLKIGIVGLFTSQSNRQSFDVAVVQACRTSGNRPSSTS